MKTNISAARKAVTATGFCSFLILYPNLQLVWESKAYATIELKSESQIKSEASRYDTALRAIAGITILKLDSEDGLKQAIAILDRERPYTKFLFSKLVAMALNDATYIDAVKKRAPDKQSAEAFVKTLIADPNSVLKLEGAESLQTRIQSSVRSDADLLKRSGDRLKEGASKIKQASLHLTRPRLVAVRAGFRDGQPTTRHDAAVMPPLLILPVGVVILNGAVLSSILDRLPSTLRESFGDLVRDPYQSCMALADDRRATCIRQVVLGPDAKPSLAGLVECDSEWLTSRAACNLIR